MNRTLAFLMSILMKRINEDINEKCFVTYDYKYDTVDFNFIDSSIALHYDTIKISQLQDSDDIDYFKNLVKEDYVTEYINNKLLK